MQRIRTKPIHSAQEICVFSAATENTMEDTGSRHPISVDFTGPMYCTLSRKTEKPTAVPLRTMTAITIHAVRSNAAGTFHAFVKRKSTSPPISMPQPVMVRLPQEAMMGRDKRV